MLRVSEPRYQFCLAAAISFSQHVTQNGCTATTNDNCLSATERTKKIAAKRFA